MGDNKRGKWTGFADPPTPRQRVYLVIVWITEHMAWLPTAIGGLLTIGAAVAWAMVGDPPDISIPAVAWGAGLLFGALLVAILSEVWRHSSRTSLRREIATARVFMIDALDPIAVEIARMPSQTRLQRERHLVKIVSNACGSIPVSLPDADRPRVIVYRIKKPPNGPEELVVMNHIGRKDKPGRIINQPGTRGEHIFKAIYESRSVMEPDILRSQREGVEKEGKGYRTFISSPIVADDTAFGMVSVDSPSVGSLDDNDVAVVELMAALVAIAFAEAVRS